jgi:hypothetical protein
LPLFVREGGIVPLLLDETDTLCDPGYVKNSELRPMTAGLHVLAFPAATQTEFALANGDLLRCSRPDNAAELLTITAQSQTFMLEVHADAQPASVVRDGAALAVLESATALDAAPSGWRFDPQSRSVFVKFEHGGGTSSIRL